MYQSYWQLTSEPFPYRTESCGLYQSNSNQAASLRLRYCFANNAGAALLLGQSGVGKSSLLQQLRKEEAELRPFVHVTFPLLSSYELLRTVATELCDNEDVGSLPTDLLLAQIGKQLSQQTQQGQHAVIVFDEAHLFSNDNLNEVVLPLLNLVISDPSLSFSVILAGHPALVSQVARNAQIRERISVKATLDCFTEKETADFIHTRMVAAGAQTQVFTDKAVDAVYALSNGNPRRISRLCDMALLIGYADQIEIITETQVESLAVEFLPAAA